MLGFIAEREVNRSAHPGRDNHTERTDRIRSNGVVVTKPTQEPLKLTQYIKNQINNNNNNNTIYYTMSEVFSHKQ